MIERNSNQRGRNKKGPFGNEMNGDGENGRGLLFSSKAKILCDRVSFQRLSASSLPQTEQVWLGRAALSACRSLLLSCRAEQSRAGSRRPAVCCGVLQAAGCRQAERGGIGEALLPRGLGTSCWMDADNTASPPSQRCCWRHRERERPSDYRFIWPSVF